MIGRIERGLVVMGCIVDVVRMLSSNKRGNVEKHWHSTIKKHYTSLAAVVLCVPLPTSAPLILCA